VSDSSFVCEPCGLEALPAPDGKPVIRLVDVEKTLDGKKVLDGLIRPERGQVLIDGVDISRLSRGNLYKARRRFGMLFQGGALFDSLTVFENVAFPLQEKTGMGKGEIRERVLTRLAQVGLEEAQGKYPDELSGGMVRRVAFARAMVTDPEIILFDEPTTGLDPIIRNSILNLICHTYHQHGFTMVMISHDIPEIFQWSHYVVVLHGGKVVEAGPTAEVVRSVNPFVQQIIRGDITGPVHLM
jgi:phospholipid/cholesterol/gamma-HCH transport system ATP-binding protein